MFKRIDSYKSVKSHARPVLENNKLTSQYIIVTTNYTLSILKCLLINLQIVNDNERLVVTSSLSVLTINSLPSALDDQALTGSVPG